MASTMDLVAAVVQLASAQIAGLYPACARLANSGTPLGLSAQLHAALLATAVLTESSS
jgi:hypothetical protein